MVGAAGVSVDVAGPGPTPEELDFRAIYFGGENFGARAKALSDLKAQHDIAYARFRIGQDARAALDDAQNQLAAATIDRKEAGAALEAAITTAEDIVTKANEQASAILAEAKSAAGVASATASQTMLGANEYAAKKKASADAATKRSTDNEAETVRLKEAAQAALAVHQAAQATADQAKADANALMEAVRTKIGTMRQAIMELAQ
jgi:colicin import membrane protein